jgi:hypothetical protein
MTPWVAPIAPLSGRRSRKRPFEDGWEFAALQETKKPAHEQAGFL